jgi:transcriptional regulator with XRE-family HTH domain
MHRTSGSTFPTTSAGSSQVDLASRPKYQPQKGLATAVRQLRKGAGLNQGQLAEKAGISPSWLSRIESGAYDPSWGNIRLVAQGLNISLRTLSERAEECEAELTRAASNPEDETPAAIC